MSTLEQDQALLDDIKNTLDESVERLDAATRSRLTQARHKALAGRSGKAARRRWLLPVSAFASTAAAVLAITLWTHQPDSFDTELALEDLEIIASNTDLEFLQDLEFYEWLESDAS